MSLPDINQFLSGAICLGEVAIALLFLRFRCRTGDRLFTWFAAAFAMLAAEKLILSWHNASHAHPAVYTTRLIAFLFIIFAVIGRNRRNEP